MSGPTVGAPGPAAWATEWDAHLGAPGDGLADDGQRDGRAVEHVALAVEPGAAARPAGRQQRRLPQLVGGSQARAHRALAARGHLQSAAAQAMKHAG